MVHCYSNILSSLFVCAGIIFGKIKGSRIRLLACASAQESRAQESTTKPCKHDQSHANTGKWWIHLLSLLQVLPTCKLGLFNSVFLNIVVAHCF